MTSQAWKLPTPHWIRPAAPRPLPITRAPAHHETLDSYMARLATANRLDRVELRAHIADDPRSTAPIPLARLVSISGQPQQTLLLAIPELTSRPETTATPLTPQESTRPECRHCAASKGRPKPAIVHAEHHDAVCHKHRLWLGDAYARSDASQPGLTHHPQILRANLTHRRILRRHGSQRTTTAYRDAAWVCERWHDNHEHDHQLIELLTRSHGPNWTLARTDATIQASRYPQIVALTRLLASPHWRSKADPTDPAKFIAEVQRTVSPRYIWTLSNPNRRYDPLVQTLGQHLHRPLPQTTE